MIRPALIVLAISLTPLGALAQGAEQASVELFDRGVERLRERDHPGAAAAFRESYRLAPRVTTMCNLALTYDRWGPEHRTQAVRAYRTCARDDDTGRYRRFAEQRIGEIERELVLLETETEIGSETAAETETEAESVPETVTVSEADPPPVAPMPAADVDHPLLFVGIGTGALALAATAAGIVLAQGAQSTLDALRAELGPMPVIVRGSPQHDQLEGARAQATAATALYVTAGVLAATAVTFVVIDLATTSSGDAQIALLPSGVTLRGHF